MTLDCLACLHTSPFTAPDGKIDFSKRICVRMPPTPVPLPAGPNQISLQSMYPVVARGMYCGCFEPKDAAEPVVAEPEEGEKSH